VSGIAAAAFRFAGIWTEGMYQRALDRGLQPTDAPRFRLDP
jgi:hypothetical protein